MGYDIHITKREHWWDKAASEISRAEWEEVLRLHPELMAFSSAPGKVADSAQMLDDTGEVAKIFRFGHGNIFVKNPTRQVLIKMLEIARELNARVVGDNEEAYNEDGVPDKWTNYEVPDG
jgi:hypothetical protein